MSEPCPWNMSGGRASDGTLVHCSVFFRVQSPGAWAESWGKGLCQIEVFVEVEVT